MSANISRRAFAASLLTPLLPAFGQDDCTPPAGGTPTAFGIPAGQTNIARKPISTLNATEVARLRLAYQKLRDLTASDPNDPRGWMQQAMVHCFQCGGNPNGSDIHQSWNFFPWHRAYLYYHEKILGQLIGDNTFRLPYWDWDVASSRNLPPIYRDRNVNGAPNSLFDANRDVGDGSPMPGIIFPANSNPMNAPSFASFGGGPSAGGALENGPHGLIHVWSGDKTMAQSNPDMGRLDTAARDPIFFAHHCNIDRLWSEWLRRNPAAHKNPAAPAWPAISYTFFDENKKLRRIRVRDVVNTAANLGYNYPPGAALAAAKPIKRIPLRLAPTSKAITLYPALKRELAAAASSGLNVNRSIVVENAVLPAKGGIYLVFANDPPENVGEAASAPNYLGYVGLIKGSHHHRDRPSSLVLRATAKFTDLAASASGVRLTLKPSSGGASSRLSFSGVYLIEE